MKRDPFSRNKLVRDAIWHAIHRSMRADTRIYCLGEGAEMKAFYDAPALLREFPERVITLPISEDGNVNMCVGMALAGLVPVYDVIGSDFMLRCADSIGNTAAKMAQVGEPRTLVIRAEFFTGGPTTGQRIESLFTHIPGLNVVVPSNPADAFGLMSAALNTKAVTLFFEDRMIEDDTTPEVDHEGMGWLEEDATAVPMGAIRVRKPGTRLTVVSYGLTLRNLDTLLADSAYELLDLRTLYPLDMDGILRSVRKTGALLVVEPAVKHGGVGAEIVAQVAETVPGVRVGRLGAPRVGIPAAREWHERLLPNDEDVMAACRRLER